MKAYMRKRVYLFGLLLLAASSCFVWSIALAQRQHGQLAVTFLDVGQGDAVLVSTPSGRHVLIDAGSSRSVLRELGTALSFHQRMIDVVIATHPDFDHIGGMPSVFARYDVAMYIEPGVHDDGADYAALLRAVETEGLSAHYVRAGAVLDLGDGVRMEILSPRGDVRRYEANRASIVMRLMYGQTSFLLTGDAPAGIEYYLASRYGEALQSDVLKLGHHGSKTSSSELFLETVQAEYAVVSAGCENRYGHPDRGVVARVRDVGTTLVDTCTAGSIVFESDGHSVVQVSGR